MTEHTFNLFGESEQDFPSCGWLMEHCPSYHSGGMVRISLDSTFERHLRKYIINDADEAMLFKLTWGGK